MLTNDVEAARKRAARAFQIYGSLPSYRALLDREGVDGPGDLALIGDEREIERGLRAYVSAGATELCLSLFGRPDDRERTRAFVASLARSG